MRLPRCLGNVNPSHNQGQTGKWWKTRGNNKTVKLGKHKTGPSSFLSSNSQNAGNVVRWKREENVEFSSFECWLMEMAIIASIHQILVCELCWTDSRSSTYWIFPSVIYLKPFHFRASLIFIWFEFLFFCIFFTLCDFPDGNDATEAKKKSNGSLWRRIWQRRAARKYRSIFIFYRAQLLKSIFFWTEWGEYIIIIINFK